MAVATEQRRYISSGELKKHSSLSDLWISIQGKVYDVTDWVKDHPGGDIPLLSLAGQDATDAFVAFHPASAWKILDRFFAGCYLSDYRVSEVSKDYRRLVKEFSELGLFEKKGHVVMITLSFMFGIFSLAVYLVSGTTSPWAHLTAGGMLGWLWIQSGWIGHDSSHYNAMTSPKINRITQFICGNCLTGMSIAWWKRSHNAHHLACNSLDFDPDLQQMPLFAVSSKFFHSMTSHSYQRTMAFDSVSRFLISYQHLTFYPVVCFGRLKLIAQSLILLLSKKEVAARWLEIAGVILFFIWYACLVSFLPSWGERVMFVIASLAVTGIQQLQFCLNHFSCSVYVGKPQGNDWFEKQTTGTLNITCSPWMDWFHGGLQFQIEHHLFPRMPRCHLRRISPFVRDLCKKHKLHYSSVNFWEANKRIVETLRATAMEARIVGNPTPKNLLWEALNTHG